MRLSVATGMEVSTLNRGRNPVGRSVPPQVRQMVGDVNDDSSLAAALGDCTFDAVINFLSFDAGRDRLASAGIVGRRRLRRPTGDLGPRSAASAGRDRESPEIVAFTDTAVRMNYGGCDPQGRFYCGTMAYAQTPGTGSLYRLDADLSVQRVIARLTISNGLQWRADGRCVYHNDTPTGRVDVLDFDAGTGTFGARRSFAELEPGPGFPTGWRSTRTAACGSRSGAAERCTATSPAAG